MRTLSRTLLAILTLIGSVLMGVATASPARAADPAPGAPVGVVDVVQVSGYIDAIVADFLLRSLQEAERTRSVAFVVQLDSPGSVLSEARLSALLDRLHNPSGTTVAVWVGPSGSDAGGQAGRLVQAATHAALAPGSHVEIDGVSLGADEAPARGITDIGSKCQRARGSLEGCAATIGDFLVSLPEVATRQVERGQQVRVEPLVQTRFGQLGLANRMLHTAASPPVAYLLFVMGMALLLFEFFTAGVGVAGLVGAGSLLLGAYGLAALPTREAAVGLLIFAMFGYGVDVQTGVPRVWTGIATVSFVAGSLLLYDGLNLSWITLLFGVVGMTLAMLGGMPAMVRTRFSTPTIGREWMIGDEGTARTAVDPEGTVMVRGAPWRARTNRATPIAAGDPVRVAAIEGLVLEVEPTDGAARDYRR